MVQLYSVEASRYDFASVNQELILKQSQELGKVSIYTKTALKWEHLEQKSEFVLQLVLFPTSSVKYGSNLL